MVLAISDILWQEWAAPCAHKVSRPIQHRSGHDSPVHPCPFTTLQVERLSITKTKGRFGCLPPLSSTSLLPFFLTFYFYFSNKKVIWFLLSSKRRKTKPPRRIQIQKFQIQNVAKQAAGVSWEPPQSFWWVSNKFGPKRLFDARRSHFCHFGISTWLSTWLFEFNFNVNKRWWNPIWLKNKFLVNFLNK